MEELLTIGRVLERLVIVAIGGMSLYLGWRLFDKGIDSKQVIDGAINDIKLTIKSAGPGIFFLLLGGWVVYVSVTNTLTLTGDKAAYTSPERIISLQQDVVQAINSIEQSSAALTDCGNSFNAPELVRTAAAVLTKARDEYLKTKHGKVYEEYLLWKSGKLSESHITPVKIMMYEQIEEELNETLF